MQTTAAPTATPITIGGTITFPSPSSKVGETLGIIVGRAVGDFIGVAVGFTLGLEVGLVVGFTVGVVVGV